jgi:GT2 family glycosyltransferase
MPTVSVVIPTYNAVGQVEGLLTELQALSFQLPGRPKAASPACGDNSENLEAGSLKLEAEVILADDASPDGSAQILAAQFPWLTVIAGEKNVGFGANVKRGVNAATGDYLLLLNSDVELRGDPLTPLVEVLESDATVFAAMPLIYNTHLGAVENLARLYGQRGLCWHTELSAAAEWTAEVREAITNSSGGGISAADGGWKPPTLDVLPIPAVLCGAAFMCRRERFVQLGGFDPRYRPFYWEDVALGYAAARRGWRTVTVPSALVVHRHSESISAKVGERKLRYLIVNQLRFVQQYRRDLRSAGLRRERLWWLARAARALAKGDLEMAGAYATAAVIP